jgi:Iron-containing alcohol dehydrogenase
MRLCACRHRQEATCARCLTLHFSTGLIRPFFRALILTTPNQQSEGQNLADRLGPVCSIASATIHTPIVISEQAPTFCRQIGADRIVALGVGSTTGLSKAIALRTDLPQLIIPTTYAGSEMTPILGETENAIKTTQKSPRILPEVVIYDVNLTLRLPVGISGTSGINAIAHAVEPSMRRTAIRLSANGNGKYWRAPSCFAFACDITAGSGRACERALRGFSSRFLSRGGRNGIASQALPYDWWIV